ncbi:right-handed parallel beta-helix repeat-containing protein [Haloglomus halophilum]|uniref:right-handed parallel beta-helix repeat-containing protein n=1 Tax=Haloglomus halophilum TaxID=2962672 RepID=UPI0020C9A49D|nr:right-handed parallel beta-helix repeat-containing protein [Haloglomus halophilum]
MTGHDSAADSSGRVGRRTLLQAAGTSSASVLAGCGRFDPERSADVDQRRPADNDGGDGEHQIVELEPQLNLGGRRVVSGPDSVGYDTIRAAWRAAGDGDVIFVHGTYDAEAADEPLPVTLDYTEKEVMLSGGHPSASVIDARHAPEKNVVEVIGKAHADYRNKALVQHLKIRGGDIGLRIRGATYSTYKDLIIHGTGGDGVRVEEYTDSQGQDKQSFGMTFRNCMVWRCGGAGVRLEPGAQPHGTTFYGCDSLFNGLETGAPGVALRGYSSRWVNGVVQNNGGFGIEARAGASQSVRDAYLEGNGMTQSHPHGIFVDETSPGFTLQNCYFQGGYFRPAPSGRDRGFRGIAVAGADGVELRGCTYKNYTGAFCHLRETEDADVHIPTHTGLDSTDFQDSWDNRRVRSSGIMLESDLSDGRPEGRFVGDVGTHDGTGDGPWGLAMWNGRAWVSVMNGTVIR